ncbi:hypothetical protein SAMN00017477_1574 [Peptoniphilus asaccharolyticus DSM 20463]|uniref:Uncharacterized protein n=1 Tax=Peptoniphilus asaccharolyticus DSM 20463 TaxID=573058 RepID=A0A1W1V9G5_PEPAS|nr:hypothetical protein [Peptoniphilus asaccharolyticus]MBL7575756.1 hypothetical protein [Peptoniphilus asaccharolyticus]SMB90117.1 hypothetical protein SAMN00017477_1574 [Peptoniphilus asaccharolyticus DSM 20463]
MIQKGWIKTYRELLDKSIWLDSTPEQKVILMTLLLMANHSYKEWEWKGEKYAAKPGQFITSLESIVKNCGKGISVQNVRTALKRFEKYGFLTNESTNQNRLITIVNWNFYQGKDEESNKHTNNHLTDRQQTPNNHLTPNKNEKNDNNKNNKYPESVQRKFDELRKDRGRATMSDDDLIYLFGEEYFFEEDD